MSSTGTAEGSARRSEWAARQSDEKLDLRGVLCPINFVRTKLALEEMEEGQVLEVILDDGEPMRNVPRSVKAEGHKVLWVQRLEDDTYRLLVRKLG